MKVSWALWIYYLQTYMYTDILCNSIKKLIIYMVFEQAMQKEGDLLKKFNLLDKNMNKTKNLTQKVIGLALSGGGMRAAAFHAGVLKYLAEQNLLERVAHISSVSGGSLFTGLVFRLGQYKWPTSTEYLCNVLPNIDQIFTSKSLQCQICGKFRIVIWSIGSIGSIGLWFLCKNSISICTFLLCICSLLFFIIFVRARVALLAKFNVPKWYTNRFTKFCFFSQAISHLWDIKAILSELPKSPVWSINATSTETGRRFRFKGIEIGDYQTEYANAPQFSLAKAMAISAAVPGLIGPMHFKTNQLVWKKSKESLIRDEPHPSLFTCLHLYDGGVYDNLGMEPMFDAGKQTIKKDTTLSQQINYLLISDEWRNF